jgi:alcohol dehydrogenase
VAGAHCLAEAIGGLYGHPHGYCCAASMPPIMEYNLPVIADKYARLAQAFGLEPARGGPAQGGPEHGGPELGGDVDLAVAAIDFIRQLNRDLAVPPMRQLIRVEDLTLLGRKAEQNTSTPSNPRPADAAAFTAMFARELGVPTEPSAR